jgi:hypothetical protein
MGLGVSKAGAEAQALVEAVSSYDSARQPLSERIVAHGRKLGMQLGVGIMTDEDRAFAKLLAAIEALDECVQSRVTR